MTELPIVKRLSIGANLLRGEYGLYGHAKDQEQAAALIRELVTAGDGLAKAYAALPNAQTAEGSWHSHMTAALAKATEA